MFFHEHMQVALRPLPFTLTLSSCTLGTTRVDKLKKDAGQPAIGAEHVKEAHVTATLRPKQHLHATPHCTLVATDRFRLLEWDSRR